MKTLLFTLLLSAPVYADTEAVVEAANDFMALLSTSQKTVSSSQSNSTCLFSATIGNVTTWSNVPVSASTRNGLQFSGLTTEQYNAALAVVETALSDQGVTLFDEIRLADKYISGEVTNSKGTTNSMWGFYKYYIAFIGTPSTTTPWTLQIGGHHLAYNLTYNGTYVSGTPMFSGTEPNSFTISGTTYSPLGTPREILESLRPTLTTSAKLSGTFSDVVFGPNGTGNHDTVQPKSYPTSDRGQLYSSLTTAQQELVLEYINFWINKPDASISDVMAANYTSPEALADTYIGYGGSSTTLGSSGSYFRVDGPRLWIEYVVQGGVYDQSGIHDHSVVRDKLADYGAAYGSTTVATTLLPPEITSQPASAEIAEGDTLTLTVAATGTPSEFSYQWYLDDTAITDATDATYEVTSATTNDAGEYKVTVTSTAGKTTSDVATIVVTEASTEPFETFLEENNLSDAEDDSDGDGISALLEWFFGGDPATPDSEILPTASYDSSTSTLSFSFLIPADTGSVTWDPQTSTNLTDWISLEENDQISIELSDESDDYQSAVISITDSTPPLFFRIVVTAP
ncbi:DUF3500 domain-containing protein [Luteolibacter pohnpeiensis]|uniref:DUF3500 domain-containing protein n=1 Tax=Luteolibacter pohnpeiensis TaxID=454153 RepID=A0A934S2K6_9BACT|nr:DUF3500 domain-containing protein [Luteolibacter pohnpeiensis]MBK1881276.1 DUF3500 domain-containing protein [Luteolibacter pohnpeiensis]